MASLRKTDEILTINDVAALLKVVDKTVYTMAQRAEMPAFKVRGQWRFRRSDLEAWIDQRLASRKVTVDPVDAAVDLKTRSGSRR